MASYLSYDQSTGFAWRPCSDLGSGGSSEPPPIAPVTNDLVLHFGDDGGVLTRWDVIAIVAANGASPAVVTLERALAGIVGQRATIVNVGTAPVLVATSELGDTSVFPPIMPGETSIFSATNHGEVYRIVGAPAKAAVYAQRAAGDTFVPNDDSLTRIEGWTASTNDGGAFDGAKFTVPRTGTYAVSAAVLGELATWQGGGTLRLCVVKNGDNVFTTFWSPPLNGLSYYAPVNIACTLKCEPRDELWVALRSTRSGGATALVANGYENTLSISEL